MYKVWTKEEEEILIKYSERMTEGGIAKKLKRSPKSVGCKRRRLGVPSFVDQTDKLTGAMVADLVGVHKTNIYTTWEKKGLKMEIIGKNKMVDEKTLLVFMREHPELWNASDCDYYFFSQYKWFKDRLEIERVNGVKKKFKRWTEVEISRAKMLKRRGLTHREIAEKLGRSKIAIDHASKWGMLK